ncbi:MAG: M48 family metallopeptidase [Deltaproteobacteria bacterium]|nr:M48 family metallopeptidase [Deltaproteobacteria bacterium]MBK8236778.1 M48 family metallopeptidase [Deltaproteobacteria bacterium]MBP7289375.1 M48 family metallopeptidase [Nannocystaceae bacterium]
MNDREPASGAKARRKLKTFPELDVATVMHPWDVQATRTLQKVPGLETLTKKVMEYGFERVFYLENVADNVRVGEHMFPRLHRLLLWACKILGVAEPELYVNTDPVPNAYTYGHTRPFVVLTSGLVDMLDDEELLFVIGHELGHVRFGHVLYTVLARNIVTILEIIGKATLGLGQLLGFGLALPLFDWYRKAELSADRAGMLCVQDADVPMRVLMKLAGGSTTMYEQMNQQEFLRQIRAYEDADESTLNKMYKVLLTAFRTHPFPIMRAKHIDEWVRSGEFTRLTGVQLDG